MRVYSALTGLQFQVGMRRGEVLSILDSILMKFAQVFVIQTHISFVNAKKDLGSTNGGAVSQDRTSGPL